MGLSNVVYSSELPEKEVTLGNRKLVNFNITEELVDEENNIVHYKYNQLIFNKTDSQEVIDKTLTKEKEILAKELKTDKLNTLTVTYNGNEYDADDSARLNMSTVVLEKEVSDIVSWKLADNSWVDVPVSDIVEALFIARQAVENIIKGIDND